MTSSDRRQHTVTTICGKCEREWSTDTGNQVCPACGNDGDIEPHAVRVAPKERRQLQRHDADRRLSDRRVGELLELWHTGHPPASSRTEVTRVVCAWCRKVLRDGTIEPTSHGMCDACQQAFERRGK